MAVRWLCESSLGNNQKRVSRPSVYKARQHAPHCFPPLSAITSKPSSLEFGFTEGAGALMCWSRGALIQMNERTWTVTCCLRLLTFQSTWQQNHFYCKAWWPISHKLLAISSTYFRMTYWAQQNQLRVKALAHSSKACVCLLPETWCWSRCWHGQLSNHISDPTICKEFVIHVQDLKRRPVTIFHHCVQARECPQQALRI